tara:strand:- start:48 stop:1265 length:1218 start_codon:yes stop_codon:yes gene_type:complete
MAFLDNIHGGSGNIQGRLGSDKWGSDVAGLFLKKFAGEVMTVFDEKNIMKPLHTIRTITKGKSAQFPVIGTANAGYYTPGTDILNITDAGLGANGGLNSFKQTEVLINIDKVLMASTFISSIDELVSHFDVRAPYSHQLGEALANQFDKNVLGIAVKTGAKTGNDGDNDGNGLVPSDELIADVTKQGSVVYAERANNGSNAYANPADTANTAYATPADVAYATNQNDGRALRQNPKAAYIRRALFESARLLDEKDVPQSDRYCIMTPAMYYELINNSAESDVIKSVINKDIGGEGSIAAGTVTRVAGITILVSNHLPSTDLTSTANQFGTTAANDYRIDCTDLAGIVFQKGGFGTLKLMDLTMESEYLIQRQGTLMVSKYSMGHGALRPESVVVWSDGRQDEASG